jgi:hypothetical protein
VWLAHFVYSHQAYAAILQGLENFKAKYAVLSSGIVPEGDYLFDHIPQHNRHTERKEKDGCLEV